MMRELGFGQAEALRAITSVAAGVCGLGHRKGRIAPGFDADILAVDGDPIADPDALHRMRAVYARGTAVPEVFECTALAGVAFKPDGCTVEATFDGAVSDHSGVPGVSSVEVDGRVVRCHVRGSVAPLLNVLATAGVTELLSREPSLEELFLALYGGDGQTERAQHAAR